MGVDAAVALMLALINQLGTISTAVAKAKSDGRQDLTAEEWSPILARDDVAKASQLAALAQAKAEGR